MSSRRIERCYTDNIYLIESIQPEPDYPYERQYLIMGNSGNTYTVTISNQPTCTCPDHTTRGNRCKHIYFVLIRIMNTYNYTEKTYSDEEYWRTISGNHNAAHNSFKSFFKQNIAKYNHRIALKMVLEFIDRKIKRIIGASSDGQVSSMDKSIYSALQRLNDY